MNERGKAVLRRIKTRRERSYAPKTGSLESAMLILKEVFSEETTGVSDSDFWVYKEDGARLKPNEACFQFYLAGVDHKTLAEILLGQFPRFRAGVMTGDLNEEMQKEWTQRVADRLYDYYPEKYKNKHER